MKNIKISALCLYILSLAINASAAEMFKYNNNGKRDPFIPLIGKQTNGATKGLDFIESIADIKLEGIIWSSKSGSVAIINGNPLKEGESIGSVKVTKIEQNKVYLLINEIEESVSIQSAEELK